MNRYRINIISLPDREYLVAEIIYNGYQWVEINQEKGNLEIQFYPHPNKPYWEFNLEEALDVLAKAKQKLLGIEPKDKSKN